MPDNEVFAGFGQENIACEFVKCTYRYYSLFFETHFSYESKFSIIRFLNKMLVSHICFYF